MCTVRKSVPRPLEDFLLSIDPYYRYLKIPRDFGTYIEMFITCPYQCI